jgi:hypothetical protein
VLILGHRVGDVLTAAHDLQDDIDSLGARQIARMSDNIVNQIRKISTPSVGTSYTIKT